MYIPTQEERYAKRSMITLILCVIGPSAVIGYLWDYPVLDMLVAFTLPLGLLFSYVGMPLYWLGIGLSLLINIAVILLLIYNKRWTGKTPSVLAITWGMLLALALKTLNAI